MRKVFSIVVLICSLGVLAEPAPEKEKKQFYSLQGLKNYQVNTPTMVSAGLPTEAHLKVLKGQGVSKVIDLIPGDRSDENALMKALELDYYNVQVVWDNPTLANFQEYVSYMSSTPEKGGKTLTHCRLNWRGAVFTYLYRVTQLNESDAVAKKDLLAIWEPNETWQAFIEKVKGHYQ